MEIQEIMGLRNSQDLCEALEHDQIVPYFQPLVELRTGTLTSFEVLARWNHPVEGMIRPDEFIALAEETGYIGQLTAVLLRQVFDAAAAIPPHVTVAVNISPLQFRDRELPTEIARLAEAGGFPLSRLVLEVTESALVGNVALAREIMSDLKQMGVRLALDDFGTGYSSLKHLQALPFDELKVDASFVRSMGMTRESRKIAAAVIGLGQSLGLTTVAEGVETQHQADMLLWLGCDCVQGWLYGRPVPAERLAEMLASGVWDTEESDDTEAISGPVLPRFDTPPAQRLAQLQAIYDGVPTGLCFLDPAMRYMSVNKRMAEINGFSVAEHLGRRAADLHPEYFPQVEKYLWLALQGESVRGVELNAKRHDGSPFHLLLSLEPVRDEANEVIGVSVAVVDVTRKLQAEEALVRSEALLKAVFQAVPVGLVVAVAPGGEIVMSNPQAEKIVGRPIITAATVEDYRKAGAFRANGRPIEPEEYPLARVIRNGGTAGPDEMLYRGPDGIERWVSATAASVTGASGEVIGGVVALQDLDDVRRERSAMLNRIAELEQELLEQRKLLLASGQGVGFDAVSFPA
jgi:PAS domain S-box-containing protein